MTFREKSAAITIAGLAASYGVYGWRVLRGPMGAGEAIGLLVGLTVVLVIVMIVGHLVAVMTARPEAMDERDRMIELRGPRNAYFVMVAGIMGVIVLALLGAPSLTVANAVIAVLVVAEIVRYGSQLVYYRIGL